MIASLGMYDMPHLRGATDRFWSAIAAGLEGAPATLTRDTDLWEIWQSPDLVLAQTCGMPYRTRLHGKVELVGTPDYDLPDCPPGHYFSYIIQRRSDRRDLRQLATGGIMAFNDALSQSGWAAPLTFMAGLGLRPERTKQTHSHLGSISAVLQEQADYAAIDAVTLMIWAQNDMDAMALLDTLARTSPTPALPYITAIGRDPAPVAKAIGAAIDNLTHEDRCDLRLRGFVDIPASEYLAVPAPPSA